MAQTLEPSGLSPLHLEDRHTPLGLTGEDLLGMYRTMLLARRLDQRVWSLNRMGKAPFVVSSQGHEGAQVGSAWAIKQSTDIVLPYYRDLGVVLTLGLSAYEVLLGVFARRDDPCSGGRQMPSHWGARRLGIVTGSSPIATHIPHAAGIAKARQLRNEDGAVICYFGDGAASKGDFHEACNFAGIHRLPLVLVCENNGYAISVPLDKESAVSDIATHAHSYGFTGVIVDGNDPLTCTTPCTPPSGGRGAGRGRRSSSARRIGTSPTPPTMTTARTAAPKRWSGGARRTPSPASIST